MDHRHHAYLALTQNNLVGSRLIRAVTWSHWSHGGMLLDDQRIVESVAAHGVRERPLADLLADSTDWVIIAVPSAQPDLVRSYALDQLGKPYDKLGAIGLGLRRNWQEDDKWWCTELLAQAFQRAGEPLFRAESLHRIAPEHIWMLPLPIVARKAH